LGGEDIFKPTIRNGSLNQDINDNGGRILNFATSKNLDVKSAMFTHLYIYKYPSIFPDGRFTTRLIT